MLDCFTIFYDGKLKKIKEWTEENKEIMEMGKFISSLGIGDEAIGNFWTLFKACQISCK